MTQQLATFDEILFTKGGFSDKKMHKNLFCFRLGLGPGPAGGAMTLPRPPSRLGGNTPGNTPSPFSFSLNVFGVSMSGPVF